MTAAAVMATALGCSVPPPRIEGRAGRPAVASAASLNQGALEAIAEGRFEAAEELLQKALRSGESSGVLHNSLGQLYYARGELYLAAWEFEIASKALPHRAEPWNNLGLVYEASGRLDKAVDEYRRALDADPENIRILGNLARARFRLGDRAEDLVPLLERLTSQHPSADWRSWAGSSLMHMAPGTKHIERVH